MDLSAFLVRPEIAVGVPGPWASRDEAYVEIAKSVGGFRLVGDALIEEETEVGIEIRFSPYDPDVRRAFAVAGRFSMTVSDLDALGRYRSLVHLVGEGGSKTAARRMLRGGRILLDAGGIAVKVETTGIAHTPHDWRALTDHPGAEALYFAFVTLVEHDGVFFTTGMHNLGVPDAIVGPGVDSDEAGALLEGFSAFVLTREPEIADGDLYRDDPGAPEYRVRQESCTLYPKGSLNHNPYGLWGLEPV